MSGIAENLKKVNQRIKEAAHRSERPGEEIKLVIITKTAPAEDIKELIRLGHRDFGENHFQRLKDIARQTEEFAEIYSEALSKNRIKWHMVGHLQRNKVPGALQIVSLIHSVDTLRLAEHISNRSEKLGITAEILMQVNTSGESQKFGVSPGAAPHLAEQITTLPNIKLCGLMTIAPLTENREIIKRCFGQAQELFNEIRTKKIGYPDFNHLSMGMSQDFETAIEYGATILRIGTAIFSR